MGNTGSGDSGDYYYDTDGDYDDEDDECSEDVRSSREVNKSAGYYGSSQMTAASRFSVGARGEALFAQFYGGEPDHVGMMEKRGKHNTAYKHRYFILKSQMLYYFKSAAFMDMQKPLGEIKLRKTVKAARHATSKREFTITTPSRTWHLRCMSSGEAQEWWRKSPARS